MTIWVDIETLPGIYTPSALDGLVRAAVPATLKKPATIAAWCQEHRDEGWRRTALDPVQGQVLCIAAAEGRHGEVSSWYDRDCDGGPLRGLAGWLDERDGNLRGHRPTWGGWSVAFDLAYIRLHAGRLELESVTRRLPDRSWLMCDVKAVAAAYDRRLMRSLGATARFFGLDKAEGLHGSEVLDAYARGEHERIERYCRGDVEITREIARRIGA